MNDLDIKKQVFENLEKHRTPGTLITSNTSGIPIHFMSEGRSEDFQKHFCGTHFFNPARYLKLFEIIPGPKTDPDVIDFLKVMVNNFLEKHRLLLKILLLLLETELAFSEFKVCFIKSRNWI